jgi:hypothetical protein
VIHWKTLAALIIDAGAVWVLLTGHPFIASGMGVLAYYVGVTDIPKYTTWFNYMAGWLTVLIIGYSFDHHSGHFPFITLFYFSYRHIHSPAPDFL